MAKNPRAIVAAFVVVAAIFAMVMMRLIVLRFSQGGDFAPYSTLRADPLGMKAFFEAAKTQPGITASRYFERVADLPNGAGTTLFLCGASVSNDTKEDVRALEQFATAGGRIVIAFSPSSRPVHTSEADKKSKRKTESEKEKPAHEPSERPVDAPPWENRTISIEECWDFEYAHAATSQVYDEDEKPFLTSVEKNAGANLPATLPWHSTMFFEDVDASWHSIYQWRQPSMTPAVVVMERAFGQGTIVLCSDSYLLSNEAMQADRHSDFLAWLAGPSSTLLFDESHLGTRYNPGVMGLVRQYHLQGVFVILAVMAGLFVWKNMTSLLAKRPLYAKEDGGAARDDAAALLNLLRRGITPRQLPRACVEEWRKTMQGRHRLADDQWTHINHIVEAQEGLTRPDPAGAYRALCTIIMKREVSTPLAAGTTGRESLAPLSERTHRRER